MNSVRTSAATQRLRIGLLVALAISVAACVFCSRGWGVGQDSRLMHYVVFLMQHGFAPYRDIVDMNMPVSYMVEWAGMSVFGMGDGAWRCFDLFLLLLGCVGAAYLAGAPQRKFVATLAALLVALVHFSGGAFDAAQRDYTLAVLLLIGTAALFFAVRRQHAWPMFIFAVCFGFASGIKPLIIPLPFVLLLATLLHLRRSGAKTGAYLAASLAGAAIPIAAICLFLQHYHAWQAFFGPISALARYHRGNGNLPLHELLLRWLPRAFAPLFALAAIAGIAAWRKNSWRWEDSVLLAIGLFGLAGYFYQGKGWSYHAATALMFFAVLAARLLANASSRLAWNVAVALALLLPAAYVPVTLARHPHHDPDKVEASLMSDLASVVAQMPGGVGSLSGHIQCMDWNSGCLGALYRLRLLPVTGDIFDFWLFPARPAAITAELQRNFFAKVQAAPPEIFIVTAHDWPTQQGFAKLDRWPEFADWLNANYTVALERHEWTTENRRPVDRGYRIYFHR